MVFLRVFGDWQKQTPPFPGVGEWRLKFSHATIVIIQ
jgi:hypothetical protein